MASASNKTTTPSCTIFLGEGTKVKLSYTSSVFLGLARMKIKFGAMTKFSTCMSSQSSSPIEAYMPHLSSKRDRSNVIPTADVQEEVLAARTNVHSRLIFPKRITNIK